MRDLQPVLVGVGLASRVRPDQRLTSPLDLIAEASRTAIADAGAERDLAACIDTIACVRLFADSASWFASPFGGSTKPPLSLAARIGARPARAIHSAVGGNIPQKLINECAQAISEGECEL
ncbi:MAG TPA: hypothetical protein VLT59_15885, partial [Steroidobacteraceae bacterium]|nr:hypothetical protein [Steroidobacteraceae bacterium]